MKPDPREFPRLNELTNLTQEILLMPKSFNSEKLNRVLESFLQQVDGCRVTAKPLTSNKTFPFPVMYLHAENKRLITKQVTSLADFEELMESSFVEAYWELNSIGDGVKALLQAAQIGADPECLLSKYRTWGLEEVLTVLDDKPFAEHYFDQVAEWKAQLAKKNALDEEFLNTFLSFTGKHLDKL